MIKDGVLNSRLENINRKNVLKEIVLYSENIDSNIAFPDNSIENVIQKDVNDKTNDDPNESVELEDIPRPNIIPQPIHPIPEVLVSYISEVESNLKDKWNPFNTYDVPNSNEFVKFDESTYKFLKYEKIENKTDYWEESIVDKKEDEVKINRYEQKPSNKNWNFYSYSINNSYITNLYNDMYASFTNVRKFEEQSKNIIRSFDQYVDELDYLTFAFESTYQSSRKSLNEFEVNIIDTEIDTYGFAKGNINVVPKCKKIKNLDYFLETSNTIQVDFNGDIYFLTNDIAYITAYSVVDPSNFNTVAVKPSETINSHYQKEDYKGKGNILIIKKNKTDDKEIYINKEELESNTAYYISSDVGLIVSVNILSTNKIGSFPQSPKIKKNGKNEYQLITVGKGSYIIRYTIIDSDNKLLTYENSFTINSGARSCHYEDGYINCSINNKTISVNINNQNGINLKDLYLMPVSIVCVYNEYSASGRKLGLSSKLISNIRTKYLYEDNHIADITFDCPNEIDEDIIPFRIYWINSDGSSGYVDINNFEVAETSLFALFSLIDDFEEYGKILDQELFSLTKKRKISGNIKLGFSLLNQVWSSAKINPIIDKQVISKPEVISIQNQSLVKFNSSESKYVAKLQQKNDSIKLTDFLNQKNLQQINTINSLKTVNQINSRAITPITIAPKLSTINTFYNNQLIKNVNIYNSPALAFSQVVKDKDIFNLWNVIPSIISNNPTVVYKLEELKGTVINGFKYSNNEKNFNLSLTKNPKFDTEMENISLDITISNKDKLSISFKFDELCVLQNGEKKTIYSINEDSLTINGTIDGKKIELKNYDGCEWNNKTGKITIGEYHSFNLIFGVLGSRKRISLSFSIDDLYQINDDIVIDSAKLFNAVNNSSQAPSTVINKLNSTGVIDGLNLITNLTRYKYAYSHVWLNNYGTNKYTILNNVRIINKYINGSRKVSFVGNKLSVDGLPENKKGFIFGSFFKSNQIQHTNIINIVINQSDSFVVTSFENITTEEKITSIDKKAHIEYATPGDKIKITTTDRTFTFVCGELNIVLSSANDISNLRKQIILLIHEDDSNFIVSSFYDETDSNSEEVINFDTIEDSGGHKEDIYYGHKIMMVVNDKTYEFICNKNITISSESDLIELSKNLGIKPVFEVIYANYFDENVELDNLTAPHQVLEQLVNDESLKSILTKETHVLNIDQNHTYLIGLRYAKTISDDSTNFTHIDTNKYIIKILVKNKWITIEEKSIDEAFEFNYKKYYDKYGHILALTILDAEYRLVRTYLLNTSFLPYTKSTIVAERIHSTPLYFFNDALSDYKENSEYDNLLPSFLFYKDNLQEKPNSNTIIDNRFTHVGRLSAIYNNGSKNQIKLTVLENNIPAIFSQGIPKNTNKTITINSKTLSNILQLNITSKTKAVDKTYYPYSMEYIGYYMYYVNMMYLLSLGWNLNLDYETEDSIFYIIMLDKLKNSHKSFADFKKSLYNGDNAKKIDTINLLTKGYDIDIDYVEYFNRYYDNIIKFWKDRIEAYELMEDVLSVYDPELSITDQIDKYIEKLGNDEIKRKKIYYILTSNTDKGNWAISAINDKIYKHDAFYYIWYNVFTILFEDCFDFKLINDAILRDIYNYGFYKEIEVFEQDKNEQTKLFKLSNENKRTIIEELSEIPTNNQLYNYIYDKDNNIVGISSDIPNLLSNYNAWKFTQLKDYLDWDEYTIEKTKDDWGILRKKNVNKVYDDLDKLSSDIYEVKNKVVNDFRYTYRGISNSDVQLLINLNNQNITDIKNEWLVDHENITEAILDKLLVDLNNTELTTINNSGKIGILYKNIQNDNSQKTILVNNYASENNIVYDTKYAISSKGEIKISKSKKDILHKKTEITDNELTYICFERLLSETKTTHVVYNGKDLDKFWIIDGKKALVKTKTRSLITGIRLQRVLSELFVSELNKTMYMIDALNKFFDINDSLVSLKKDWGNLMVNLVKDANNDKDFHIYIKEPIQDFNLTGFAFERHCLYPQQTEINGFISYAYSYYSFDEHKYKDYEGIRNFEFKIPKIIDNKSNYIHEERIYDDNLKLIMDLPINVDIAKKNIISNTNNSVKISKKSLNGKQYIYITVPDSLGVESFGIWPHNINDNQSTYWSTDVSTKNGLMTFSDYDRISRYIDIDGNGLKNNQIVIDRILSGNLKNAYAIELCYGFNGNISEKIEPIKIEPEIKVTSYNNYIETITFDKVTKEITKSEITPQNPLISTDYSITINKELGDWNVTYVFNETIKKEISLTGSTYVCINDPIDSINKFFIKFSRKIANYNEEKMAYFNLFLSSNLTINTYDELQSFIQNSKNISNSGLNTNYNLNNSIKTFNLFGLITDNGNEEEGSVEYKDNIKNGLIKTKTDIIKEANKRGLNKIDSNKIDNIVNNESYCKLVTDTLDTVIDRYIKLNNQNENIKFIYNRQLTQYTIPSVKPQIINKNQEDTTLKYQFFLGSVSQWQIVQDNVLIINDYLKQIAKNIPQYIFYDQMNIKTIEDIDKLREYYNSMKSDIPTNVMNSIENIFTYAKNNLEKINNTINVKGDWDIINEYIRNEETAIKNGDMSVITKYVDLFYDGSVDDNNLSSRLFWTSSEISKDEAWMMFFEQYSPLSNNKKYSAYIRPFVKILPPSRQVRPPKPVSSVPPQQ